MAEFNKPNIELSIEFAVELLLFLYPYGADQMNLPHNFWLGLACWIVAAAIAVRMFWIFPLWNKRLRHLEKALIAFILVAGFVAVFYKPVVTAYGKRTLETEATGKPNNQAEKPKQPEQQPEAKTATPRKSRMPTPTKPQQDNSVHLDHDSKIEQKTVGDCSPNIVGGSSTVNCEPPERHLSEQQKTIFGGLLIPEGLSVTLSLSGQDKDSQAFGYEIYSACNGKIPPTNFAPIALFSGPPPQGVIVRIHDKGQGALVQLATQIAQTLNAPTIPVTGGLNENARPNTVEIIIGPPSRRSQPGLPPSQ